MGNSRSKALEQLVSDLEAFRIGLNDYYDDAEPQAVFDTVLTGKLSALASFCSTLGWSELSQQLGSSLPLHCTAIETLENVQGFVHPEIRRLMALTEIDV